MALMTGKEYRASLRNRRPLNVYMAGEKIDNPYDHPIIAASINSIALTYELAEDSKYRDDLTATSALSGKTINRFCHLHQSPEDLYKKLECRDFSVRNAAPAFSAALEWMHSTLRFLLHMKWMKNTEQTTTSVLRNTCLRLKKRIWSSTDV